MVDDYEVGLKTTMYPGSTTLRINVAAFYSDYQDIQRTISYIPTGQSALSTAVLNAAAATIKGGELEVAFLPIENLQISGEIRQVMMRIAEEHFEYREPSVIVAHGAFFRDAYATVQLYRLRADESGRATDLHLCSRHGRAALRGIGSDAITVARYAMLRCRSQRRTACVASDTPR
jgi:hypothetical protein